MLTHLNLRSIASGFFLTLAILFATLWVRSYYCVDSIWQHSSSNQKSIASVTALLRYQDLTTVIDVPETFWLVSSRPNNSPVSLYPTTLGFGWQRFADDSIVYIPDWFLVLTTGL